ncbi:MAG TPA: hypothetical protein VF519_14840 [Mycobacteriales bacterium]
MRWPWRRKPKGGRVVFIGTSPFDVAQAIAAVPTPSPVVEAFVPDEPEAVEEPRAGVQLGFADGSTMTLEEDDPRAVALRAAAARLTGTG